MKKRRVISLLLGGALMLTGCAVGSGDVAAAIPGTSIAASQKETEKKSPVFRSRDLDASYSESESIAIVLNGRDIACDSANVSISGGTVTINQEGTYLLSGTLTDGSVIVDADKKEKVQLVLNGVSIHSETSAAIYVRQADKVYVTLAAGTRNSLGSGGSFTADGNTNVDAVIFSRDDLTLNGTGQLTITSPGGHGIVSKDSLRLAGGSYAMDVSAHGLSGKDEVSIANGTFDIIAGKDGIHAEHSGDADAGFAYLENGTYQITAGGDGISASGSCTIVDGEYTITTGGGSETVRRTTSGQGFAQSRPERSGGMGGKIMDRGNQLPENGQDSAAPGEKTGTVSAKGIKAGSLTIEGGSFRMDCADDGLHIGGNLTLLGGTLEIASGDDGIHADDTVTISSGSVNITRSYEGIEGQHVDIQGGEIVLNATDDGLNAAGGVDSSGFGKRGDTFVVTDDTPGIVISGGSVSITASGDGIDANGTLEITDGTVIVTGPTTGDTSVLDFDITGTISGGTFLGTGATFMPQTFSDSPQGVVTVNVGVQSAGTEVTLTDGSGSVLLSRTPELDFELVILSCPAIVSGESYCLRVGTATQNVTAK